MKAKACASSASDSSMTRWAGSWPITIAWLLRKPSLLIVGGFFVTILAVGFLTSSMRPLLPWWSFVVANGLAVVLAGAYLLTRHPGLWRRVLS